MNNHIKSRQVNIRGCFVVAFWAVEVENVNKGQAESVFRWIFWQDSFYLLESVWNAVVPVHKSSSKADINNHRFISLTSNLSKIFEKMMCYRLISIKMLLLLSQKQFSMVWTSPDQLLVYSCTSPKLPILLIMHIYLISFLKFVFVLNLIKSFKLIFWLSNYINWF